MNAAAGRWRVKRTLWPDGGSVVRRRSSTFIPQKLPKNGKGKPAYP
jgi:hypothetical protein